MSYPFTGKIKSAKFADAPRNSVIEGLYYNGDNKLEPIYLNVDFSNEDFLAFIKEYPIEKIEKTARAEAARKAKIKRDYDQKVIDNYILKARVGASAIDILDYIDKNNKNKDIIFNCKLKVLDTFIGIPKNKALQLKIRKAKTLKELLGLHYGI